MVQTNTSHFPSSRRMPQLNINAMSTANDERVPNTSTRIIINANPGKRITYSTSNIGLWLTPQFTGSVSLIVSAQERLLSAFTTGPSPAGGGSGARAPPFHAWPPGCCMHPIQHFKNVPPPAAKSWRRACFTTVSLTHLERKQQDLNVPALEFPQRIVSCRSGHAAVEKHTVDVFLSAQKPVRIWTPSKVRFATRFQALSVKGHVEINPCTNS